MDKEITNLQVFSSRNSQNLASILVDLADAAKTISKNLRRAGLINLLGMTGTTNVQGEKVKKLDLFANETFIKVLAKNENTAGYASEENEGILDYGKDEDKAKYVISLDPLDGSGNIDVNVSIGSIFSIFKRKSEKGKITENDFLQKGSKQVCAGYFLYSTSTMLVYTAGNGVNGFTLDPDTDEFILSHPEIKIPKNGKVYSINESYSNKWTPQLAAYINKLKIGDNINVHNAKYIGALVADFHRILFDGGIFLYPSSEENPNGKLRLLYESSPMAFIAVKAEGAASNGKTNILDITAEKIHQRTPLFIGGTADVELLNKLIK